MTSTPSPTGSRSRPSTPPATEEEQEEEQEEQEEDQENQEENQEEQEDIDCSLSSPRSGLSETKQIVCLLCKSRSYV